MHVAFHRAAQEWRHSLCALLMCAATGVLAAPPTSSAALAPAGSSPGEASPGNSGPAEGGPAEGGRADGRAAEGGATEHHPGKIVWVELVTPDLPTAESFYGDLFGWTFQPVHAAKSSGQTEFAVALFGGRPVGGLLQKSIPPGEHRQSAWLSFIAANDVNAAVQNAVRLGATIRSEPKTYAGRGRQAVLADPEGAVFAILESSGDPPDFLAEPGEWIWSSLLVQDPKHTADFYQAVFGYDVFDLPSEGDDSAHVILSTDDYARASINSLPAGGHRRPHWLNFVRVESAADTSAKAVSLGGRVLVAPYVDRHGGNIAVIADPAGAPLGLLEWSDTDSKVEPK